VITEQESHTANIPIRQYNDAGTYRCRCPGSSRERCHLKVDVIPDIVHANFSLAFLHESYNGSFSAKGNPLPMMRVEFGSDDCNYNTVVIDSDNDFTRYLIIIIPTVTEQCQGVTITCLAGNVHKTIDLIVEESEIQPSMTPKSPVTTNPGDDGTTSIYIASSLNTIFIAMIVVQIWNLCM